jgi:hypothetical protein
MSGEHSGPGAARVNSYSIPKTATCKHYCLLVAQQSEEKMLETGSGIRTLERHAAPIA